jgi:thiamine-phosphate pyrophosphorylase
MDAIIGLGPFRFTTTKKNLSPILGLEGYQTILNEMKTRTYNSSICDWWNWLDDIPALMETGIYGIAFGFNYTI